MTAHPDADYSDYSPAESREAVVGGIWAAAELGNGPLVRGLLNHFRATDSADADQVAHDLAAAGLGGLLGGAR